VQTGNERNVSADRREGHIDRNTAKLDHFGGLVVDHFQRRGEKTLLYVVDAGSRHLEAGLEVVVVKEEEGEDRERAKEGDN